MSRTGVSPGSAAEVRLFLAELDLQLLHLRRDMAHVVAYLENPDEKTNAEMAVLRYEDVQASLFRAEEIIFGLREELDVYEEPEEPEAGRGVRDAPQ